MEHHSHSHSHSHNHSAVISNLSTAFVIGSTLNFLFVIAEGVAGFWSNSVSLISDAGHNLGDCVSLLLSWLAFGLTKVSASKNYTYGYKRSTILVSLVNAVILLVAVGAIVVESIEKLFTPQEVNSNAMILFASIGVFINIGTALLFMGNKHDINIRGAFLHMVMDALVSVGVVISGVIIKFTGLTIIDPIIGLLIAVVIFVSTWNLLKQSLRLSLDGVPTEIDVTKVEQEILNVEGVLGVHHTHVWALGTSENALTTHVIVANEQQSGEVKRNIRHELQHEFRITHATIETEPEGFVCSELEHK